MRFLTSLLLIFGISYVKADGAHGHSAPVASHDSYGPPSHDTYGPPSYEPPSYHPEPVYHDVVYEEEEGFDFTVIIVACLVLIGLSILFPLNVNIQDGNLNNPATQGRKKRYIEEIERADFAGRTNEIYDHLNMALEPVDRNCLKKITCEVGNLAYDAGLTSHPFLKLAVPFVPGKYEKYMKYFLYAENCHKMKCSAYD